MRGKAKALLTNVLDEGIIPAGAGKRKSYYRRRRINGDHPRGCGEKVAARGRGRARPGSSPRVRGKAQKKRAFAVSERIIPAGAGKSGWGVIGG